MKLIKVKVENFRSIEDSTEFEIGDMTCLVGKNEAGKTALLHALDTLRPYGGTYRKYDQVVDYPRRFLSSFDERHPNQKVIVATTWWELSDTARKRLSDEFGEDAIKENIFTIEGGYGFKGSIWILPIDEAKAVKNLISKFRFNAVEKKSLEKSKTIPDLISTLEGLKTRTEKHEKIFKYVNSYRNASLYCKGIDLIKDLVPHFLYVSHYDRMSGQISVEQLIQQEDDEIKKDDKIFLDFFKVVRNNVG